MGLQGKTVLKSYFNVGDTPSENDFIDFIDSVATISSSNVENSSHLAVSSFISSSTILTPIGSSSLGMMKIGNVVPTPTISTTISKDYVGLVHQNISASIEGLSIANSNFLVLNNASSDKVFIHTEGLTKGGNDSLVQIGVWGGTNGVRGIEIKGNPETDGSITFHHNVTSSMSISSSKDIIGKTGSFDFMDSFSTIFADVNTIGNITASGNISSSGTIIANNFTSTGDNVGGINFSDGVLITGSITASGAISASTTIQALTGSFNQLESTNFIGSRPINTKTANGTLAITDAGTYIRCGSHKLIIPLNSNVAFAIGTEIEFIQTSSIGHLMVTASAGEAVTLNSRFSLFSASGQFSAISCKKVGTDEWDIIGDLTR